MKQVICFKFQYYMIQSLKFTNFEMYQFEHLSNVCSDIYFNSLKFNLIF